MNDTFHLAQLNVARAIEPMDSPRLAEFVAALAPLNAMADASPGFVWRLQTESGDATSIRAFDDPLIIVNLTVWESIEALRAFAFGPDHAAIMRRRREWFERAAEAYVALWWVPAGVQPTPQEARERLEHLRQHGPSAHTFTFREPFPSPGIELALRPGSLMAGVETPG